MYSQRKGPEPSPTKNPVPPQFTSPQGDVSLQDKKLTPVPATPDTHIPTAPPELPGLRAEGYTHHMESRPEGFLHRSFRRIIDASFAVRERAMPDVHRLKIFRIKDLFQGRNEVFMGFGQPNVYLVCPNPEGGYQKFAGKSLYLEESKREVIDPKKEWVQSGVLFRFRGLSEEALKAIQDAMVSEKINNKRYITCVNATCRLLEEAGFQIPGETLSSIKLPAKLLNAIEDKGLEYKGQKVSFDVIRTTKKPLLNYTGSIIWAEATTLWRKKVRPILYKAGAIQLTERYFPKKERPSRIVSGTKSIAPPLPRDHEYKRDLFCRISRISTIAIPLRMLWGPHHIMQLEQSRVNVDNYLPNDKQAFPDKTPNFSAFIKRNLLFNRFSIACMRFLLAQRFDDIGPASEVGVYDSFFTNTESDERKYNLVLYKNDEADVAAGGAPQAMNITPLRVKNKIVDWILAKHVLVSGFHPHLRWAGEIWKEESGEFVLTGGSGSYQPLPEETDGMCEYLKAVFPNLKFRVGAYQ